MRYYARITVKGNRTAILEKFAKAGISEDKVIIDAEKQQKHSNSIYTKLKHDLELSQESLCIDSLFSLGKNAREITKEIGWFKDNGIDLYVLDIPSSMNESSSKMDLLFEVNKVYANREIDNLKEGQKKAGSRHNKSQGIIGRPSLPYPDNWEELFDRYERKEITSTEFIEQTDLSRGTFYNMQKRYLQERRATERKKRDQSDDNKTA